MCCPSYNASFLHLSAPEEKDWRIFIWKCARIWAARQRTCLWSVSVRIVNLGVNIGWPNRRTRLLWLRWAWFGRFWWGTRLLRCSEFLPAFPSINFRVTPEHQKSPLFAKSWRALPLNFNLPSTYISLESFSYVRLAAQVEVLLRFLAWTVKP